MSCTTPSRFSYRRKSDIDIVKEEGVHNSFPSFGNKPIFCEFVDLFRIEIQVNIIVAGGPFSYTYFPTWTFVVIDWPKGNRNLLEDFVQDFQRQVGNNVVNHRAPIYATAVKSEDKIPTRRWYRKVVPRVADDPENDAMIL